MEKTYRIEGLDCANCARKMEEALNALDGIASAKVNFLLQKVTLQYDADDEKEVIKQVKKTCRKIEPDCELIG